MPSTSRENEPSQRRVLNLKALAILVTGGIIVWVGMNALHARQVVRTSDYLRDTAEEALTAKNHSRAFDLLEQYLALNPRDDVAEEKISQLLEDHGNSAKALQRAFQINEKLLRKDSARDDLRLRQIRIAEQLGRYSDAAVHLKTMRDKRSEMAEVWHFSGIVAKDTGDVDNAISYFETAVELEDPHPQSFEFLAELTTTEQKDPDTARELLDTLIEEHDSAEARRIRAAWLIDQEQAEAAIKDLWKAIRAEPSDLRTNAMLLKAVRMARTADRDFDADRQYRQLIIHLQRNVAADADDPKMRLYLSSALWAVGHRDAAIRNLENGIERDPRHMEMHEVLVDYLVSDRRYDRAQEVFERISIRSVDRGRREFMRGRLLMSQKQWQPAIEAFEMALGFAQQDPNMTARARVCMALCRRESGDNDGARESYQRLIQTNPDFEGGRLGMASAYLRSNQLDLAIAEYRQLVHVDGVPAFLANLMIRRNLTLPRQSRDWTETEALLTNTEPLVKDEIQRSLLQADLLFAKGFPSQAMDLLDEIGRRMPDRPEIGRAYERLSSVHGEQLMQRIRKVLDDDSTNVEAHTSILRLMTAQNDTTSLDHWLNAFAYARSYPQMNKRTRMKILARTTTSVADAEQTARGASPQTQLLLKYGQEAWRQLAQMSPQFAFDYVRFMAQHRRPEDALEAVNNTGNKLLPGVKARCWLECLRQHSSNPTVGNRVQQELGRLIDQTPEDINLRLAFADSQILRQQTSDAETLLRQVTEYDENNGRAFGRLAWIASLIHKDANKALQFSSRAAQLSPSDPHVRSIRGLTLAESGQMDSALAVFNAIPDSDRSMTTTLFEARSLLLAERRSEALELVRQLSFRPAKENLAPAEQAMLKQLQQLLNVEAPQVTSR